MKLITLNTWGGRSLDPLLSFLRKKAEGTDIFCFQELLFGSEARFTPDKYRENLFNELCSALPEFTPYPRYAPEGAHFGNAPRDFKVGQAIFAKKHIAVTGDGGFPLYPEHSWIVLSPQTYISGSFQFVEINVPGKSFLVGNVHGLWMNDDKKDTPERLEQSRRLAEFFAARGDKHILCGDFNLRPETESVAILSRTMKNLIKEFGIKSTRNQFYKDMEKYKDYIADYVFVSPDTKIKRFEVLSDEVSDHAPLLLEFD